MEDKVKKTARERGITWDKMSFHELDYDALLEHAESLGGELTVQALDYLDELDEQIPFTEEMKAEERAKLKAKTKRKKDKDTDTWIDTGRPLYTDKEIEDKINKDKDGNIRKTVNKYEFLAQKRLYCTKFYPERVPKAEPKEEVLTPAQKRKALRERIAANGKAKK